MTNPKPDPALNAHSSPNIQEDIHGSTVATPEGDNEFAPDQPLKPIHEGHQKPPAIDTNSL